MEISMPRHYKTESKKYVYMIDLKNLKITPLEYLDSTKNNIKCKFTNDEIWNDAILGEEVFYTFQEAKLCLLNYIDEKIINELNNLIHWKNILKKVACKTTENALEDVLDDRGETNV